MTSTSDSQFSVEEFAVLKRHFDVEDLKFPSLFQFRSSENIWDHSEADDH
jgi:hypothetical protein